MCKVRIVLCAAISFILLSAAFAQVDATKEPGTMSGREGITSPDRTSMTMSQTDVLRSTKAFLGRDVKNNIGDTLGSVKDITVDQSQDKVQYVILSSEGRLHPVPWSAFRCSDGNEANEPNAPTKKSELILNISKEQLITAPTIDSIDTTQLSDTSLWQKVSDFYAPYTPSSSWTHMKEGIKSELKAGKEKMMGTTEKEGRTSNIFKASELIGMKVQNLKNEDIASIKDLVVDTRKGNIAYGLAGFGGVLGVGEKIAAVPWSAFAIQPDRSMVKLDATKDNLVSAELTNGKIAHLNQRQFAQHVHQVFGVEPYWQVYGFEAPSGTTAPREKMQTPEHKGRYERSY